MDLPTLRGDRVLLRALVEDDLDGLISILAEPAVARWWGPQAEQPDREELLGPEARFAIVVDGALADLEGVAEAYSVTGEWDFVAIIRVPRHEMLAEVVTGELVKLPGVSRTQTMVAFEVFSRHDLEAMFSIGT